MAVLTRSQKKCKHPNIADKYTGNCRPKCKAGQIVNEERSGCKKRSKAAKAGRSTKKGRSNMSKKRRCAGNQTYDKELEGCRPKCKTGQRVLRDRSGCYTDYDESVVSDAFGMCLRLGLKSKTESTRKRVEDILKFLADENSAHEICSAVESGLCISE